MCQFIERMITYKLIRVFCPGQMSLRQVFLCVDMREITVDGMLGPVVDRLKYIQKLLLIH